MPIFDVSENKLISVEQKDFSSEKELQRLLESNLEVTFNCRFIATEFSTGSNHAGRIDTLALSEENNPVIIEYKVAESSSLVTQSLYYLHWLHDHKGDFELAVQKKLGRETEVDWSAIRVICIAPNYKKYDLHAVQMMGADIELWKYRLFANNSLYFEEIFHTAKSRSSDSKLSINTKKGEKDLSTMHNQAADYSFDVHLEKKSEKIQKLAEDIREFITGIDDSIEEIPKKLYIAYKTSQNIACMEIQSRNIKLYLKLNPSDIPSDTKYYRDVSSIGHYGTGDVEFTIASNLEFDSIKDFINIAYNRFSG